MQESQLETILHELRDLESHFETPLDAAGPRLNSADRAKFKRLVLEAKGLIDSSIGINDFGTPLLLMQNLPSYGVFSPPSLDQLHEAIGLVQGGLNQVRRMGARPSKQVSTIQASPYVDAQRMPSRKIFIVHGHDEAAREAVARFLEKIGFEPVILHEQASQNRTVIEKIEAYHDVGFAVVLLTPDDEGCLKGGKLEPRVRQNVLLELGYFMGGLGRNKMCVLKRGNVEIPSDFAGLVWVSMDDGNGWKQTLGQELQVAGYTVDWNKVMR